MRSRTLAASVLLALAIAGCDTDRMAAPGDKLAAVDVPAAARAGSQVVKASGDVDVSAAVAQFQALLGDPSNGITPGQQEFGRREISWDGVPPELTNTDALPADQFFRNGLIYTIVGSGLRITDNDFADINPTYADQFATFSAPKTFAPIGSPVSEVTFRVAGSSTPAAVTGFGVVFSDVDRMGAASIKLFTAQGQSLGQYHAPIRSDENGQSFIGVVFDEAIVARVVITSGQAPLGADEFDVSDGGNRDLVVFDNLLFGEPKAF
jgi:hypothetical protein